MANKETTLIQRNAPTRDILLLGSTMQYREEGIYTMNLARSLHRLGHKVQLAVPPGPLTEELKKDEIEMHLFPFLEDPRLEIFKTKRFRESVDFEELDFIHSHNQTLNSISGKLSETFEVPYFLTIHSIDEESPELETGKGELLCVLVPSDAIREYTVNDLGVHKNQVEVIHPGVDLDRLRFAPVFQEGQQPIVAMSCPLVEGNRTDMFPKIGDLLINTRELDITLLVIGQGPLEDDLRREFADRGLNENTVFQSNPLVYYDILREIDLLVSPISQIGLGIFILEAMGCGKPVVASSAGGGYDVVVDNETGFLLSPDSDAPDVEEKVNTLLTDPERAQEMGKNAREHVEENFRMERMGRETIDLFNRKLSS